MTRRQEWTWIFAGWLLFTASSAFFLAAAIRSGDGLAIAGSALFLIACGVFLVPVWVLRPHRTSASAGTGEEHI